MQTSSLISCSAAPLLEPETSDATPNQAVEPDEPRSRASLACLTGTAQGERGAMADVQVRPYSEGR